MIEGGADVEELGFPAHAGMDRLTSPSRGRRAGFPRPRGDGPWCSGATRRGCAVSPPTRGWTTGLERQWPVEGVSPPTRGWTLLTHAYSSLFRGFPAHAGMDLSRPISLPPGLWFPRPRGDGPSPSLHHLPDWAVSPPTRGWTVRQWLLGLPCHGFPAHAGMDRDRGRRGCRGARFPRPRGDGPRPDRLKGR